MLVAQEDQLGLGAAAAALEVLEGQCHLIQVELAVVELIPISLVRALMDIRALVVAEAATSEALAGLLVEELAVLVPQARQQVMVQAVAALIMLVAALVIKENGLVDTRFNHGIYLQNRELTAESGVYAC
jgi:hypothetical protein